MISLHRYYLGELIQLPEWRHATRPRGVTRRGARDDDRETSGGAGYFNLPRWRITYEKSVTLHRKIVNLHLLYIRTRVDGRLRLPSFNVTTQVVFCSKKPVWLGGNCGWNDAVCASLASKLNCAHRPLVSQPATPAS